MKSLKKFCNALLTIILFIFVFSLSISFILKKFVQEDLIANMAKEEIVKQYIDNDNYDGIDSEKKAILKTILGEDDANEIVNIILDNYMIYTVSENYELSKSDYDKIIKYFEKHSNDISRISGKIDINYIKNRFTYDEVNKMVKDEFVKLDEKLKESSVSPEEVTEKVDIINIYANLVSTQTRMYILYGIGGCILLLMFINYSVSKWMIEAGISLIISGVLVTSVYNFVEFLKGASTSDNAIRYLNGIDIKYAITIGVCEVLVGIGLIILKSKIEKLEFENKGIEELGEKKNME